MERLLDLRFLSIDFLNTFLLTYRVFTDSMNILNSLKKLHESSPRYSINFNSIEMARLDKDKLHFFLETKNSRQKIKVFFAFYRYQGFGSNELSRKVSIFGAGNFQLNKFKGARLADKKIESNHVMFFGVIF
jgi:hypothetical protein